MAHKVNIGGTAYEISGGKTLVNGTAYSIDKGKTLVGGTAYEVGFGLPAFADTSWSEIIAACQNRTVPDNWAVGDQKVMTINGTDYLIDIIGKNHDVYSDGSGVAPLTFQTHNIFRNNNINNSNSPNGLNTKWSESLMRTKHLPEIKGLMPSEVQVAVKKVNKPTCIGGGDATIGNNAEELFLLSEIEIEGSVKYSYGSEGSQYAYYSEGNIKGKKTNGGTSNSEWWTRSPANNNTSGFCIVGTLGFGSWVSTKNSDYSRGVAFAFCF